MKKHLLTSVLILALIGYSFVGFAQTFVGSSACQGCHSSKYNDWVVSGHPYKFSVISGGQAPTYPGVVSNFESTWMDSLGDGSHTWNDIAGVIGGFGWKARFVGTDGHLIGTLNSSFGDAGGGHNQINFFDGEDLGWGNYHPTTQTIYNYSCFKCHTTGGDTTGTWLTGVPGLGTFSEGGVGCESCHGPGSAHISAPSTANIDRVYEFAHLDNASGGLSIDGNVVTPNPAGNDVNFLCGTCHNRSYTDPINSSGGFVQHHEQWDEFMTTRHNELNFTCVTCHDPHKRVLWGGDGITTTCESCHSTQVTTLNHAAGITCIDCHMPFSSKSGAKRGSSNYKADVRSHMFDINPSAESMFTEDGTAVRDDSVRSAALSPHFACLGCHNDDPNDAIPDKTIEQVAAAAVGMHNMVAAGDYAGSTVCQACHETKYANWISSGHPYKFSVIENNEAPTYPAEVVNFQSQWISNLGDGSHGWQDIAGVIGGFGWKVRFVGTDGHLIGTLNSSFGDAGVGHNQFNFYGGEDLGWSNYHATSQTIYNYSCFKCHTTGGDTAGTWLAGVPGLGTFVEGGVGCEACHGPGAMHAANGGDVQYIDRVYEQAHLDNSSGGLSVGGVVQMPNANSDDVNFMCGTCHNRSYTDPINSSGGFIQHHEQWDELSATRHNEIGFDCSTCHDPHKRVLWDGDGITTTCETCHSTQVATTNHAVGITCIDCHMPFAAKSGAIRGNSGYKADVRSHLFAITADTNTMFNDTGDAVRDDSVRSASLSLHFACLGCHNDDAADAIPDKTISEALAGAIGMHQAGSSVNTVVGSPFGLNVYPNPVTNYATINYRTKKSVEARIEIYSATGQVVFVTNNKSTGGVQTIQWNGCDQNGASVNRGLYFVRLTCDGVVSSKKIVVLK